VTIFATITYHTIERPMIALGQQLSGRGRQGPRSHVSRSASDSAPEKISL
jgi:peptidoglycan/LPS O-acetylase OafA/YrhL